MRALIVDDEEDIGIMVSKLLTNEGYEVDYVNRIGTATEKIQKREYGLVFLDLNLPDGNGFDLMPKIREKNIESKVIVISAYDSQKETNKAEELGVSDFIKKPFSKSQVINVIRANI